MSDFTDQMRQRALHVRAKLARRVDAVKAEYDAPIAPSAVAGLMAVLLGPGLLYWLVFDDSASQQQFYATFATRILPETYYVFLMSAMFVLMLLSYRQYYRTSCIEEAKITFSPSARNAQIIKALENSMRPFMPTPWAISGHIQSFLFAYWPLNIVFGWGNDLITVGERELLEMSDGGLIAVDWYTDKNIKALPDNAPVLLILPGVVGRSDNAYVKRLATAAAAQGWRSCCKSYRGVGVPMRDARPETWDQRTIQDMDEAVEHIKERYPEAIICGAGFSFGGMQLLSYLGARQDNPLAAGVSLSGSFDAELIYSRGLKPHVLPPYDLALYFSLTSDMQHGLPMLSAHMSSDLNAVLRQAPKTLDTWHDKVTRHYCDGDVPDTDAYFRRVGNYHANMLAAVERPALCFMAEDDPLIPPEVAERAIRAAQCAPGPILLQTQRGGHCGWFEGMAGNSWADDMALAFLKAAVQV